MRDPLQFTACMVRGGKIARRQHDLDAGQAAAAPVAADRRCR
jgi:hypothetical protein